MNLAAMVGLAAVIFGEKVLRRPRLVAGIAGAALLYSRLLLRSIPRCSRGS